MMAIDSILKDLKAAARKMRQMPSLEKNASLHALAVELERRRDEILSANQDDIDSLPESATPAFRDRLLLNAQRVSAMAESLNAVAELPDPVGEVVEDRTLPNGLVLKRVRAPLGVIFMIFESRPNVILEAFALAFKSGNTILLRGGSESRTTAKAIYLLMKDIFSPLGFQPFHGLEDYDRSVVTQLLRRKDVFDVVVPRGGESLIEYVQANARMPIIKNDRGLCHTYVDDEADFDMAARVVANAKMQRPGVCNSLETVLVHDRIAREFLPKLYSATVGLQWRGDERTTQILNGLPRVKPAEPEDWDTEYLDLIMNCRVVDSFDEALAHIERHGSKHSEAIMTRNREKATRFQNEVDAAAVYWNASTRFTDGFEFGLGGELGISTQKLHVRGPVGLRELTTPRWLVIGNGQTR
jgi:glutamate-5-semialdehyde dehydrogenase